MMKWRMKINSLCINNLVEALEDAEAEMSDLEYEINSKSMFRFIQPPKTHKENLEALAQADARYDNSKHWLDGEMSETYYEKEFMTKKTIDDTLGK